MEVAGKGLVFEVGLYFSFSPGFRFTQWRRVTLIRTDPALKPRRKDIFECVPAGGMTADTFLNPLFLLYFTPVFR